MGSSESFRGSRKTGSVDFFDNADLHSFATYRRLGALNGFLIGLIIAASYWLPKVIELSGIPVQFPHVGAIGSSLFLILLCTLTGWITARISKLGVTILLWLMSAVIVTVSLGLLPNLTNNFVIGLLDNRFAGFSIIVAPEINTWWAFAIVGYILIIFIVFLAILQDYRLEKAHMELTTKGQLSIRAFGLLFFPALLTAAGALVTPDFIGSAPRQSLRMTHQGIEEGRVIAGDLFETSLEKGFNYAALQGVREQIDGDYELMVGEVDEYGSTVIIVAHFESGSWINCRVNVAFGRAKYFSFCAEAQRPYTIGFASLLTGEPLPENCIGCLPTIDEEWQRWLDKRVVKLGKNAKFERIAQQGRFVLVQARSSDGEYALECMFEGLANVTLLNCTEEQ